MLESMQKSEKEKLEAKCWLTYLPDADKKTFCVSLLKTVLPFLTNQVTQFASHNITNFIFSCELHVAIS